jgi:Bacterial Ig domain/Putative Ig domain/Immunoglobulin domain/Immunoglobulin I-set domain
MNRWALVLLTAWLGILTSGCAGVVSGNTNSNPAPVVPSITSQPASQSVTAGQSATFSVAASGAAPLTYQWKKNSAAISGANSSSYTTPATTSSDSGAQFTVVVSNAAGSATSSPAVLTVSTAPVAPAITAQPASQTVTVGQTATFSVAATGAAPLTYQWKKNSVAVNGATSSTYTTPATTSSDSGAQFTVVVSNAAGSATSSGAVLTVSAAAVAPAITAQPANQTVTVGQTVTFSVAATGTAPLAYQWMKNSVAINGANASSYTTPATTSSDSGEQFTVVVSNAAGSATSSGATLTVNAASTLQITTAQLSGGFVAGGYSATLAATGGSTPYSWSLASGSLPNGIALSSAGVLSGTASLAGSFSFSIQVKDASSATASRNFSINIASPSPSVAISSPASGSSVSGTISVSGTAFDSVSINSVQVSVDGGSYSPASGTNAWSYNLNTNSLSNGAHSLTAQATDAAGITATSSALAITVNNGSTASNCTLFASPSGNDSNSGSSSSSPKTFNGAASAAQPGSVVCLLAGTYNLSSTFYPPTSGSPSSWITYQSFGNGAVNFVWTGGATGQPMFKFGNGSFPSGPAYLEFKGFNLDGQNNALDGFFCQGGHHLSFIGNSINNTGGSGVGAVNCDYLTSDHNMINHNGYLYGWTSAISYNTVPWFDSYPGFHNIISNNIITGEFDGSSHHTDGNGIILDLGTNTPPALIINNVVYGNGGRCIEANVVTSFWVVNNTCYKNDLDTSLGNVGSFTSQNSNGGYFINNIALSVASNNPSYDQEGSNSNIFYYADMYFGSPFNFTYSDPSQLTNANPLFLLPPTLSIGGYATSLAPSLLGTGLTLTPRLSPALGKGIDPSTVLGAPASIVSDLKLYIYTDINGKARPQGGGSDLGAYQH